MSTFLDVLVGIALAVVALLLYVILLGVSARIVSRVWLKEKIDYTLTLMNLEKEKSRGKTKEEESPRR